MQVAHLISDLHLPTEPSPLREGFLRYLSGPARDASRLYILGDLFEYWIGDDIGLREYADEAKALAALVRYGVPVSLMHGNRDFLVGKRFAKASGVSLMKEEVIENLGGVPTLLAHGDQYCTDDIAYQKWRRKARNPIVQFGFGLWPESRRQKFASDARARSKEMQQGKSQDIMDVNAKAIEQAFARHGVRRMIHGHTHRPDHHRLQVNGKPCERIVLADWLPKRMEYLEVSERGLKRALV